MSVCVSSLLISEIKKIVRDSEIMKEDDAKWPEKNKDGRQELEIRLGNEHISFEVQNIRLLSNMLWVVNYQEANNPLGFSIDGKNRLARRDYRVCGSRRFTGILLPRAGSESSGILTDILALQGI